MKASVKKTRLLGLDLYRVLLALLVFIFHTWCHMKCTYGIFQPFVEVGAIAMSGFFMLSGFSLAYVYQDQKLWDEASILRFYRKRWLGIMPLYYVVAILYTALFVLSGRLELWKSIVLIPVEALGIQSMFSSLFSVAHNQGTWFISDLLLCYFGFPIVSMLMRKRSLKVNAAIAGILTFILSYSPFIVRIFAISGTYTNPFFRFLEFCMGIALCNIFMILKDMKHCIFRKKWIYAILCIIMCGGGIGSPLFRIPQRLYVAELLCCADVRIYAA